MVRIIVLLTALVSFVVCIVCTKYDRETELGSEEDIRLGTAAGSTFILAVSMLSFFFLYLV